MRFVPSEAQRGLINVSVVDRLSAAWNHPVVSGDVRLIPGKSRTFHISFTGRCENKMICVDSPAIERHLLVNPKHRIQLAKAAKDFFVATSATLEGMPWER